MLEDAGLLLLMVLAAPLFVVRDQVARHAVRALTRDAVDGGYGHCRIVGRTLVLDQIVQTGGPWASRSWDLDAIARVEVTHVEGDSGFADANSLSYVVVLALRTGAREAFSIVDTHPFPYNAVFDELRAAGLMEGIGVVKGRRLGCAALIVYVVALAWLLGVALLARMLIRAP